MVRSSDFVAAVILGILFTLTSCGKDKDNKELTQFVTHEAQEQNDQGIYNAVIMPLNTSVAGHASGSFEIKIDGDDFVVESYVYGVAPGVKHFQNIMTTSACPNESADRNKDGIIDIVEAMNVTGQVLLPLDSDLNSQLSGMSFGPIANSDGQYYYKRSTTLSNILSDLYDLDPDPTDIYHKLMPGQNLFLNNRVILIHGVKSTTHLPSTVATVGELSPEQMLPVACAKIIRTAFSEGR